MIFAKPKSATLGSRIAALDQEIAAEIAVLADLKSRWRDTILAGDDAARTVLEEGMAAAERKAALQTERRNILIAEHEAALARDAREEFARRHAAQKKTNEEVAAAARKVLAKVWSTVAPALVALAEARQATDLLNKAMPNGFAPLVHADDLARGAPALPREEISSKTVEQWCFKSTGNRIGDQDAVQCSMLPGGAYAPAQQCVKRTFRHVRYHPAESARYAPPISTELRFPRWDSPGLIFDGALVIPDGVGAALATIEESQGRKAARPIFEEFIPLDDPVSDVA